MPVSYKKLSPSEANAIVRAGQSPRYRLLDKLQAVYECTQYDGRAAQWMESCDVPLLERKPCVIFPSVRSAVESHTGFALGEGKFPAVCSLVSEDDSDMGGLSDTDSQALDSFTERFVSIAKLEAACRQLLRMGQAAKSAGAILGFRKGLPTVEPVWSKCATPTFNPQDADEVVSLEIAYRYTEQELDASTGEWAPSVYQYRRVIDSKSDTTFVPLRIDDKTKFPVPSTPDPQRTVAHGFGFCPVVWWRCMASAEAGTGIDGHAIHETCLTAVEGLDVALSQRHRAAIYCGDPQWFLSGIDADSPVGNFGARRARVDSTPDNPTGDPKRAGQWGAALFGVGQGGPNVAKKGPGVVWASESPEAKAQLITLPADALGAIDAHANDLLNKLSEAMFWTRLDPIALRGTADISAKAMVLMYAKQLTRVAQLRQDFGDKCLLPILSLFFRMMLAKGAAVYVPGLQKVTPTLQKMQVQVAGATIWFTPKLKLKWPEYFEPSDTDEQTRIAVAKLALDSGLVTLASAVEHIKAVFGISSVDQYIEMLKKEKAERQADALANAQAMAKTQPPTAPANGQQPPDGKPATAKPTNVFQKGNAA